ncbi:MAG: tRNA (guanosine(37)-N1)-methyltransferase TrmD, partial [Oscillospiraceae bacterium]
SIESEQTEKPYVIFMTATGTRYTQEKCKELAKKKSIILVCGHYEGMDTRVVDEMADEEISIGDFVITGGEMAALVIADSVARLQEGVLSSPEGFTDESHFDGLLECPQYTRPEVWRGVRIPEILLSGHHANIKKWRREKSLQRTKKLRPDLWKRFQK